MPTAIRWVLVLVLATSCATGYQSLGSGGGYSEVQLAQFQFQVSFKGKDSTSIEQAEDFALLRSAELTISHGFAHFAIMDTDPPEPVRRYLKLTEHLDVGGPPYVTHTIVFLTPAAADEVVEAGGAELLYNAQFVAESIRRKYRIE